MPLPFSEYVSLFLWQFECISIRCIQCKDTLNNCKSVIFAIYFCQLTIYILSVCLFLVQDVTYTFFHYLHIGKFHR